MKVVVPQVRSFNSTGASFEQGTVGEPERRATPLPRAAGGLSRTEANIAYGSG